MNSRSRLAVSAAALFAAAGLVNAQAISESFDDITVPLANGWFQQNNSTVVGLTNYFQGNTGVFPSQASAGYLGANYNNTSGLNTISNWFVTPTRTFNNGDIVKFWTRTVDAPFYPDRLQVRLSTAGASSNVGALGDASAVGDFTTLLLDINPTYTTAGYPNVWTEQSITLSGLPGAGVSGRIAMRYFVEGGGPSGNNSDYIGIDTFDYFPGGVVPSGKCCKPDGTCAVLTASGCSAVNGVYNGDGSTCATGPACAPFGYVEATDAGELPGTAAVITGTAGASLTKIFGALSGDETDMYKFQICDEANFSATTVGGTGMDTQLFLFDSAGKGLAFNDDTLANAQSAISSTFVLANGEYFLAVSTFDRDAVDLAAAELWLDAPYDVERAPDGAGAANAVAAWSGVGNATGGSYAITLTGACYIGAAGGCYANCDNSTAAPVLNALDFGCFLTKFAAGDTYANCDNSTAAPVLNSLDFGCFLTKFAGGCT